MTISQSPSRSLRYLVGAGALLAAALLAYGVVVIVYSLRAPDDYSVRFMNSTGQAIRVTDDCNDDSVVDIENGHAEVISVYGVNHKLGCPLYSDTGSYLGCVFVEKGIADSTIEISMDSLAKVVDEKTCLSYHT